MDEFVVIALVAGIWVIGLPIAVIYLLVSNSTLKATLSQLELSVNHLLKRELEPKAKATNAQKTTVTAPIATAPQVMRIVKPDEPVAASVHVAQHDPNVAERLLAWLQINWFYAVSALSLALAGLFLVQYGMENGLLPPAARVVSSLAFGAALIGIGEFIRRRFGEAEDSTTAYLPSVFAGAGIVSLFGGVLSAEMLYGLISPNTAMIGMVLVALIALVLGWFYGPLLAAVGLIGAFGAPMVLGGSDSDPTPLFGYFAIVAAAGLGVDTLRRWGWVSVLTLVLAFVLGGLLFGGDNDLSGAFALYVTVLCILGVTIPARSFWPDHAGVLVASYGLRRSKGKRPEFPTLVSAGTIVTASVALVFAGGHGAAEFWVAVVCAMSLATLYVCWSVRALALQDQVIAPIAALLVLPVWHVGNYGMAYSGYSRSDFLHSEAAFPLAATVLIVAGAVLSCLAAWRAHKRTRFDLGWAAVAALTAPTLAILIELAWTPSDVIGAYPWALHAAALALLMMFWAERFARRDGPARRLRMSLFVLSALACISFALVLIFSEAALTAALSVTVLVAAWLDRKFDLHPMTYFIGAGVVTIGYRLVADPGLGWAYDTRLWELLLSHGGAVAAFVAALFILPAGKRLSARIMLDSAAWSGGGILVSVLLFRFLEDTLGGADRFSHWSLGIYAAIWLGLALAQVQRLEVSSHRWMWMMRVVLGAIFAAVGLLAVGLSATLFSPLYRSHYIVNEVYGVALLNTLLVAYILPTAVLALGIWRLKTLPRLLRLAMQALCAALIVMWVFYVIRHFWQGGDKMSLGFSVSQPELYSYTIALLIAGAGLFYQSLARGSSKMRKAGLVVIGLVVAKVFLIDISGLEGLTRVFSLLVLGLSLAGLAWLNRWAQLQVPEKNQT